MEARASDPVLPSVRISPLVEAAENHEVVIADQEKEGVREPPQHSLSDITMHGREGARESENSSRGRIDGSHESHGMLESGSARCASRRRSSSAR